MSLTAVKFTQPTRVGTLYNTGEVAGFEPEMARALMDQGFATTPDADLDVPEAPQRFQGEAPVIARPVEIRPDTAPVVGALAQVPPAAVLRDNSAVVIPEGWATMRPSASSASPPPTNCAATR
ncbi:hypothetical protein [Roseomonas indoligenes]|uniref:Uncharacterized protein n=1 Tax=Roseomonas indoligenes TaxID=2820811 RepID=A0A940MWN1_9PROT|nr:hypothetical protein [Pararoseomonas indoligenes]MBP0493043.1 hypothetical protein [Pararoseomonas indoligenes]